MGYGDYSYEAHRALTAARSKLPTQEVFKQGGCHPSMNPLGVKFRESRDSADHPNSLGIVFALDVSGSMGEIPEAIARKELPGFMKVLLDCGVPDPHVLFMANTDVPPEGVPLQVGQFESTADLMDRWLTLCCLQGGGSEFYELALYFVARHTAMDCFEKRGRKGYLFMTGDEPSDPAVKKEGVKRWIGESIRSDIPLEKICREVERTFHSFFLIPDPVRAKSVGDFWRKVMGARTIVLGSPDDTCPVAAGLVALQEKVVPDLDEISKRLVAGGLQKSRAASVRRALEPWAKSIGVA